jgi:predicted ABC-type ATPase
MNEAIFMLGLPGSGKSTFINQFLKLHPEYEVVSADEIRLKHPDYDPKDPEAIHEICVNLAEQMMYSLSGEIGGTIPVDVIMDGGGINNSYTPRIIERMRKNGYKIKVVYIDTPVDICIQRNKERVKNGERFVPASSIIDKSYRLRKSVDKLSMMADTFETVKYFSDRYIFCDLDGTIAEYQQLPVDEYGDINFVEYGVFKYSKPVMPMINTLRRLSEEGKRIFIVSASPNSICNIEKKEWVNKHLPFIKDEDIYFVGKKEFKYVFLFQLINMLKLDPSDCMAIDDDHTVLDTYSRLHINSMHPSCFLTNY